MKNLVSLFVIDVYINRKVNAIMEPGCLLSFTFFFFSFTQQYDKTILFLGTSFSNLIR